MVIFHLTPLISTLCYLASRQDSLFLSIADTHFLFVFIDDSHFFMYRQQLPVLGSYYELQGEGSLTDLPCVVVE